MDQYLLVGIIALTFAAFAFEWLPIDAVAFTSLGALLLFRLVTPEQAIAGFSNPAVITVMMMFILSYGLTSTGVIDQFAHRVARLSGETHRRGAILLLTVSGVLSAFINNTAAVAIFMPVASQLAKRYRVSPSKILLPLSYVSIMGGTCTLIGTSTNLIVSSIAEEHGAGAFSVFELSSLGLILFAVGLTYVVLVPLRLLPSRTIISSLTRKYQMGAYLTELKVPEGSSLVGRTVVEEHISERFELNVLEVLRGENRFAIDLRNTRFEAGDEIIVRGGMDDILSLRDNYDLYLLTDHKLHDKDIADEDNILFEVQLSPLSRLVGQSLIDSDFRRVHGVFVLALNRTGEVIRERLASIPLEQWDTLLLFGPRTRVEALSQLDDFSPLQEIDVKLRLPKLWWLPLAIIPIVVGVAATGLASILEASILGAVAMIVTRTLTIQQAYQAINWTVIFLLAAILPLGAAMANTGLDTRIGQEIASFGEGYGGLAVLALVYVATALLSEIVSNNSTAVLMVPIAITVANSLGLDPKPFIMAVAFAASSSFLTPMGYQTNAMVLGPGGYRFLDYVRAGAPLKIGFWLLSTALIPVLWPF
ncbi:MAG: SLC13 family permease [Acidobacteriota bacterium]|nr:SLC13 family permease [Acidobacteriota bacterium]